MSDKCNPNYKNLNTIQSFSEQKYATMQWAEQVCMNDEYLKQKLEEIEYLTPPAVRKRFYPLVVDAENSWGCQVNRLNNENTITFNETTSDEITIDFSDLSLIDTLRSDCSFETVPTTTIVDGNVILDSYTQGAVVPLGTNSTLDLSCKNFDENSQGVNAFWYVGYDKSKNYQIRPDWINNLYDGEIPSVVRAQTFTIPEGISNGKLESVDLRFESNGGGGSNWGSPLIVGVYPVEYKSVEKTKWNSSQKKQESYNPKQYETIAYPLARGTKALAVSTFWPNDTTPRFQNFLFDKAITVNTDEKYALVIRSPLSHWEHCPRIGGWGRNCAVDKYSDGDAFLSENNGNTFIRYGRNDLNVQYKFGQLTPQDFAFQAHIRKYTSGRKTGEVFYLYLKPILTNPIKSVQVNSTISGLDSNTNVTIEVSSTGKPNDWHGLDSNYTVTFQRNSDGEYPHMAFIRAKMSTTSSAKTPALTNLVIDLDLDSPSEMYVRTPFYYPKVTPMLGANVWGRVYAPFNVEPSVEGSVEIIPDKFEKEHFEIITLTELSDYTWIDGLDTSKITDESMDVRGQYLVDNPSAIQLLKDNNVYVKPWTHSVNGSNVTEKLSFADGGIQLTGHAAYPIRECLIQPRGNNNVEAYSEWIDYSFNYDNDQLSFYYGSGNDTLTRIPVGSLSVKYNPVFIQDLTNNEVGDREDGEGLILDYFKEDFIISDYELENRKIPLRVAPVDPIRKLVLNDEELREDRDFTVDYTEKTITFPIINVNNSSTILNAGDNVSVVYTPNLEDNGISIAYRGKRSNKNKQMVIKSNYIEYKV